MDRNFHSPFIPSPFIGTNTDSLQPAGTGVLTARGVLARKSYPQLILIRTCNKLGYTYIKCMNMRYVRLNLHLARLYVLGVVLLSATLRYRLACNNLTTSHKPKEAT